MNGQAKWIELDYSFPPIYQYSFAVEFRRSFDLSVRPAAAVLAISGMGFYDVKINGQAVTDHLLTPAFTAYDKRVYYDEYEAAALLQAALCSLPKTATASWL